MVEGWRGPGASKCDGSERRDLQVKLWHLPLSPSPCNELSAHKSPIQSVSLSESGIAGQTKTAIIIRRPRFFRTRFSACKLQHRRGAVKTREVNRAAQVWLQVKILTEVHVRCTQFHQELTWNEGRSSLKDLNRPVCCGSFVYPAIRCHPVVCKTVNHELPQCRRPSHSHSCNGHFALELHPSTTVSHFGGMASFLSGVATLPS